MYRSVSVVECLEVRFMLCTHDVHLSEGFSSDLQRYGIYMPSFSVPTVLLQESRSLLGIRYLDSVVISNAPTKISSRYQIVQKILAPGRPLLPPCKDCIHGRQR